MQVIPPNGFLRFLFLVRLLNTFPIDPFPRKANNSPSDITVFQLAMRNSNLVQTHSLGNVGFDFSHFQQLEEGL
jgi:hypothetical protein